MSGTATATINLRALQSNLQIVQRHCPKQKIIAMIKADAYGHGLVPVANALKDVSAFGVANIEEALHLREAKVAHRIILNSGVDRGEELLTASQMRLDCVVHSQYQIDMLKKMELRYPVNIWLKIDTGMNRLGVRSEEAAAVFAALQSLPQVGQIYAMTHLACAEDLQHSLTQQQLDCFAVVTKMMAVEKSIARSAAILAWPKSHADWVRPGIMLYGGSPLLGKTAASLQLAAVMRFTAPIIALRLIKQGESVGYGATWVADSDRLVGVVAVGYGDGYPRAASNLAEVFVLTQSGQTGVKAKVIGRVSMDTIVIDLQGVKDVKVGDTVELWGSHLAVDAVANKMGAISYELLTGVSARVKRVYA